MSNQEKIVISGIPAIIWGKKSSKVYIHVHGKMSKKEYAESFAEIAEKKGYQTISFDLPEHGERTDKSYKCDVWNGKRDLTIIADYAFERWSEVSLFACSLGAYFSLQTFADRVFKNCMFQSPIVDMKWLVEHMMMLSNVTADILREQGEIETPIDLLRWDYYCYIIENPVTDWQKGTKILYGALDDLQPIESISTFANNFEATVTISENSKHPFMEESDFAIVEQWIEAYI